jgi:hypothetical protein
MRFLHGLPWRNNMSDPPIHDNGLIDRAISSLRETPIPLGPSPELEQRTIRAMSLRRQFLVRRLAIVAAALIAFYVGVVGILYHVHRIAVEEAQGLRDAPRINTPVPAPTPLPKVPIQPSPPIISHTPVVAVASDGTVTGHVYFLGSRPTPKLIDLAACPQCAKVVDGTLYDDSLVVNQDGTLQNVIVSISAGLAPGEHFEPPIAPVILDQKGCMFRPHVVAAMVGQSVMVRNSDPLIHTVHSMDAEESPVFNFAQPTLAQRVVEPLQVVETFGVRCDLHPWMTAWVRVFNHPYFAVTRGDGSFEIKGLAPGNYRLKAWHESLGVREKTFMIRAGNGASVDFTFEAR